VLGSAGAGPAILLAGDGEDLSTPQLLNAIGRALGRPARLLSCPPRLLSAAATLIGKRELARKLLGSLQLDIRPTQERLNWSPPVATSEALEQTVRGFAGL